MAKLGARNKQKISRMRKAKKKLSKPMEAAVKSVVKRQISATEETKFFKKVDSFSLTGANTMISYNLNYYVSAGTSNNQMIGDKIRWKGIAIKYSVQNQNGSNPPTWYRQPIVLDVYILRCPTYKTITSLNLAEVFNETIQDANLGFLRNDVKSLYKKTIRINPELDTGTIPQKNISGKIWLKRNQVIQYADFGVDYKLKGGQNYYLYVVNRSVSTDPVWMAFSWQYYFTDS